MALHLRRWRVPQATLLSSVLLVIGVGLLSPLTTGARAANLASPVSEGSATGELEGSSAEAPTVSSGESSANTRREERRERREGRQASREERRTRRAERRARHGKGADASTITTTEAGCTVSLQATPSIVTGATPVGLAGILSCPEATGAAGQTVTLYEKLAHTSGFEMVSSTNTEANGSFKFTPEDLEVDTVFYVLADGARSPSTSVVLVPQVTLSTPTAGTELFVGSARAASASAQDTSAVTFTGTVSPAAPGTTVALQREYRKGEWCRIGGGALSNEGKFSITHTFLRAGEASIRVLVHSHGLATRTVSAPVSYRISRWRERRVTIEASSDPIAYGLPLTISGSVAGAAGQHVTLLAQTGFGAFTPVAEGVTVGNVYTFTDESPLQSTRYRVATASASSGILSEGVTYSLTPAPPPSSVQAGAPLTLSGTLAPLHEGQTVELERLDGSGPGYQVIATTTVSSAAGYSLPYTFATACTAVLRISVPGDAEIQSVTGEPFTLEVTPAA